MSGVMRGWVLGTWVAAATLLSACGPIDEGGFAADVERELDRGRDLAAGVARATAVDSPTVAEALAAGYLERHRLGLGSPFRLIEYSLQDPRLERPDRERLAWALLAETVDGDGYEIDPRVLGAGEPERSNRHLDLIEGAVRGSADPDVGMLAVRLAYLMASAEGSVPERVRDRAMAVVALARDRIVSRRDARRLLRAAGGRADPMALLMVWRVERAFEVERPATGPPAAATEREAVALAPRLLRSIREIEEAPRGGPVVPRETPRRAPLLGGAAAGLLADELARYDAPPQTPVTVAVRSTGYAEARAAPAMRRFVRSAVNEERLAAEYAVLHHEESVGPAARLAVLGAAVGLRAYAQERPWFPGFDGPTRLDLEDRFGLRAVTFAPSVPAVWRPYGRRMLEQALSDLQRVLPSLDLRGLSVHFGRRDGSTGTLAVHDPASRTVYIPIETGAGTIAHEIAHDLDWQTALRRFAVRGDYGSDHAIRLSDSRLAPMLEELTPGSLSEGLEAGRHARRPAEVFARSIDWFVAVALAREGRQNGYLSSVQDDVLRGYGTVTPPDATGASGEALIAVLDQVAPVHPATRRWFLGSYGRFRTVTAFDLARRVVEAPLGEGAGHGPATVSVALERLTALESVRDGVAARADECRPPGYDGDDVRERLVRLVTEARARRIALEAAAAVAGREGREWVEAELANRTRDPAPAPEVVEALGGLVERTRRIGEPDRPEAFAGRLPAPRCGLASLVGG